jgi:hypothetical protein
MPERALRPSGTVRLAFIRLTDAAGRVVCRSHTGSGGHRRVGDDHRACGRNVRKLAALMLTLTVHEDLSVAEVL